jgi:hypothetical protein
MRPPCRYSNSAGDCREILQSQEFQPIRDRNPAENSPTGVATVRRTAFPRHGGNMNNRKDFVLPTRGGGTGKNGPAGAGPSRGRKIPIYGHRRG